MVGLGVLSMIILNLMIGSYWLLSWPGVGDVLIATMVGVVIFVSIKIGPQIYYAVCEEWAYQKVLLNWKKQNREKGWRPNERS